MSGGYSAYFRAEGSNGKGAAPPSKSIMRFLASLFSAFFSSLPFRCVACPVLSFPFLSLLSCFCLESFLPFFLFLLRVLLCSLFLPSFLAGWLVCWRAGLLASWLPCPYASLCLLIVPVLPCASLYCLAWCLASLLPSSLTFFLAVFLCFP